MISGLLTNKKTIVFAGAFIFGVVVAAPAQVSARAGAAIAKDGTYRVGSCNVVVNHFENEPSKVGIGVIRYSQTDDSAQSYVEYDTKTQQGSCVYFMTDRYKADVTVEETGDFKTVTMKCGGMLSAEAGTTQFMIDSKTGKILATMSDMKYARYANQKFAFPLIKDAAPAIDCKTDLTKVAASDEPEND